MFAIPTFDRTEGLFRVVIPSTGELIFSESRAEAEWTLLGAVAPVLTAKAQAIAWHQPLLESRLLKACFIVLEGTITLCRESLGGQPEMLRVARVHCRRYSDHTYPITTLNGQFFCDCVDAMGEEADIGRRPARAPRSKIAPNTCKHILAFALSGD